MNKVPHGERLSGNEFDGMTHDYTHKGGVVHTEILLPDHAPAEYADRVVLWNEVEKIEKAKNAQLAREIEIALPRELTREQSRKRSTFLTGTGIKSMTRKSGSTSANPFPLPTGTSRPKPRNGGRHGRGFVIERWNRTDTRSVSTTAVMNDRE